VESDGFGWLRLTGEIENGDFYRSPKRVDRLRDLFVSGSKKIERNEARSASWCSTSMKKARPTRDASRRTAEKSTVAWL